MWSCSCEAVTRVARLTDVRRSIKKPDSVVEHHGVFYCEAVTTTSTGCVTKREHLWGPL